MSTTIENLGLTLEPIAAVDVSTASTGFTMFRLTLTTQNEGVLENIVKSLFQVEYWISEIGKLEPIENGNGFLSIENNVSQISTLDSSTNTVSFNVAVPSLSNEILDNIEVKLRIYVGLTSEPSIHVSVWSGSVPLYNPPKQPQIKNAFLFRGEDPYEYYNTDLLYVQIENEEDFDTDNISFVVSYNYKDQEGTFKWEVSSLLQGNRIQFPQETHTILVGPIMLPADVFGTTDLFVAVNAVFNYDIEDTQYYTVSEISATIPTEDAVSVAPVLDKIERNDYLVYNDKTTQQINLRWTPSSSAVIPDLAIDNYTARIFMNGVLQENLTITTTDLTAQFNVASLVTNNVVSFTFDVTANYISGQKQTSNEVSINSFTFSEPVQDLVLISAKDGVDIELSFTNPSTTGLGTPIENNGILIRVNDIVEKFDYVPDASSYLKFLSNLDVSSTGTIEVIVLTIDTNGGGSLEGKVATITYIFAPVLDEIGRDDYLVYDDKTTQKINLRWSPSSSSVIPDLVIDNYTARIFMNSVLKENLTITTTGLTAQFNVASLITDNVVSFTFDVTANYASGRTQTSNEVSINSFTFSEPVQNLRSVWANDGKDNNKVDIALRFNNPSTIGLGTPIENNGILIRVNGDDEMGSVEILFDYVSDALSYLKFLSNLDLGPTGTVEVIVITQDTNNFDGESEPRKIEGKAAATNYTVDNLPIIKNVVYNNNALTFDVVTTSPLVLINRLNMLVGGELKSIELPADVNETIPGIINITEEEIEITGDYLWKFVISTNYIREQVGSGQNDPLPSPIGILMSNVGRGVAFHPAIFS